MRQKKKNPCSNNLTLNTISRTKNNYVTNLHNNIYNAPTP